MFIFMPGVYVHAWYPCLCLMFIFMPGVHVHAWGPCSCLVLIGVYVHVFARVQACVLVHLHVEIHFHVTVGVGRFPNMKLLHCNACAQCRTVTRSYWIDLQFFCYHGLSMTFPPCCKLWSGWVASHTPCMKHEHDHGINMYINININRDMSSCTWTCKLAGTCKYA